MEDVIGKERKASVTNNNGGEGGGWKGLEGRAVVRWLLVAARSGNVFMQCRCRGGGKGGCERVFA